MYCTVTLNSQIHCPLLGDKVDYGIGLSFRPAILCSLTGRYDNQMTLSTLSPQAGAPKCQHDNTRCFLCVCGVQHNIYLLFLCLHYQLYPASLIVRCGKVVNILF
jgi:hypothetical protein